MREITTRVLTFDVEEWFHLLDHTETRTELQWAISASFERNLERILLLVEEQNVKATFFCLGWIAEQYPSLIRKIADAGHELASHSSRHQLVYQQTPQEFRLDFRSARYAIEDATGVSVDTYRIPGFSLTQESLWALDILAEEAVKVDCSVFPAVRGHGGLPQFTSDRPCIVKTKKGMRSKSFH